MSSMLIHHLSVAGVRTYDLYDVGLHPGVTLILGPNGSGKTSLLEAIYYTSRGTSFRGRDRDMIRHGDDRADIKLLLGDGSTRRARIATDSNLKQTKQFVVGDRTLGRLPPDHKLPVVLFEPDELRLLTSSPQRRRDFLDGIIARLSPTYSTVLSRFARALLQRNELLKQHESMNESDWQNHLFAWDVKFAELSSTIIKARMNFIVHANEHLSRIYSDLAGSDNVVMASYVSTLDTPIESLQQVLLNRLESSRRSDAMRGFTSVGPHRDDIAISLNDHPAAEAGSRGEMRTIMLAFKLLEVELQEHHSGQKPLILLDDVFSELDSHREQALISALSGYQTIITATDLRDELKVDALVISLDT